jgi:5-methyltetrahydrofolate--homocysteine methyltransferase
LFSLGKEILFFDGAMGTMLQDCGLKKGEIPDILNIRNPDAVENVHRMYVEAGSDIICTNTFGANAENSRKTGYSPEEIITAAVSIAKRAAKTDAKVALDIGALGELIEPLGKFKREYAYDLFKQQAIAGENAGADLAALETFSDLEEVKLALAAVKENTSLPVFVTMTFTPRGRTLTGCTPELFARTAEEMGAAAIGLNCSLEPSEMVVTVEKFISCADLPVIVKPNAGLPDVDTGEYSLSAKEFARQMLPFAEMGAKIIGGCCGTTPEYIKAIIAEIGGHIK